MNKTLINIYLFIAIAFLFNACSQDYYIAREMGIKWCDCNKSMDNLYSELNTTDNQEIKDKISVNILTEQAKVLECMGGEEKLRQLNEKFSGTGFQKHYDKTRLHNCPDRVKLLSKTGNSNNLLK